jgi:hypothetical protein
VASVYSVRFTLAYTGLALYTVPANKRAVVKFVSAVNLSATQGAVAIFINDVLVWQGTVLSGQGREFVNLMFVAYAGEVLKISPTPDTRAMSSGYLLDA